MHAQSVPEIDPAVTTSITLEGARSLGAPHWERLLSLLPLLQPPLLTLSINHGGVHDGGVRRILDSLKPKLPSLTHLSLRGEKMTSRGFSMVLDSLLSVENTRLKILDLR